MERWIDKASSGVSRRAVLGAGVAIAAAGFAATAGAIELAPKDKQPGELPELVTPERKLGWMIVGLGELALTQILPAFAAGNLGRVVALCSGHPDKAKKVAAHYGVAEKNIYDYENFDSIRDNSDIDVVYVVLPNSMHAEYTIRAFKAGKHVLCEKPMAVSVEECERMIAASNDAKRKLMIAYRLRYEPFNQKMIEIARKRTYGDIRLITAANVQNVKAPNIRLSSALGGGAIGDVGIYCINAARYITGEEPVEVSGMSFRNKSDKRFAEVDDRFAFQLAFPSGVIAQCAAAFDTTVVREYRVFCNDGWFGLDNAFSYAGIQAWTGTDKSKENLLLENANQFASEMDHFSSSIVNDKPVTTPGEEGMKDVRIIARVKEAIARKSSLSI